MAEYRDAYDEIRATGADLAAVSVDPPETSEGVRQQLRLPYSILCDTKREVVQAWGIFNPQEKGGIAVPAVFVVNRERRVTFLSVDKVASRVSPKTVVDFLRGSMQAPGAPAPRKKVVPGFTTFWQATRNAIRYKVRSPKG